MSERTPSEKLGDAKKAAMAAASALDARVNATADPVRRKRLADQRDAALKLEDDAKRAVRKNIIMLGAKHANSLEDATKELNDRIDRFKAEQESLEGLATGLNILSGIVGTILAL